MSPCLLYIPNKMQLSFMNLILPKLSNSTHHCSKTPAYSMCMHLWGGHVCVLVCRPDSFGGSTLHVWFMRRLDYLKSKTWKPSDCLPSAGITDLGCHSKVCTRVLILILA